MSRPVMSRGSRPAGNNKKIVIGSVVVLVAAGAIFALFKLIPGTGATPANASGKLDNPAASVEEKPLAKAPVKPAEPAKKPESPPVLITQGTQPAANLPSTLGQAMGATGSSGPTAGASSAEPRPAPVDVSRPDLKTPAEPEKSAATPPPPPANSLTPSGSTSSVKSLIETGDRAMAASKLLEARAAYSKALLAPECAKADQDVLRTKLAAMNDDLVFSPKVTAGDSLTEAYTVVAGDALEKIRKKRDLSTEWMLIQRVNKLATPNALHVGQKLKLVRGPFHAVVHKADFRLDLFAGSPDDPSNWLYIRSFRVGLGESNGTPLGTFVVRNKQKNPPWTNPRTGEKFAADDPKNPIGEYWLGWQGQGDAAIHTGFGLHGTVDPASIGQERSMGCVRLLADDIAMVYELLTAKVSLVKVVQ